MKSLDKLFLLTHAKTLHTVYGQQDKLRSSAFEAMLHAMRNSKSLREKAVTDAELSYQIAVSEAAQAFGAYQEVLALAALLTPD